MPNNKTFEGYKDDILKYWDAIVEIGTDKPKDMDVDRRECPNEGCKFPESSKAGFENHLQACNKWTIAKRIKKNKEREEKDRGMYFIETNHDVLHENIHKKRNDKSYSVFKIGKTDNTLEKSINDYRKKGYLKNVIRQKKFIGIGVENVETEFLNKLKKNSNLIQRTDIKSDSKCNKNINDDKSPNIEESIKLPFANTSNRIKSTQINSKPLTNDSDLFIHPQKRLKTTQTSSQTPSASANIFRNASNGLKTIQKRFKSTETHSKTPDFLPQSFSNRMYSRQERSKKSPDYEYFDKVKTPPVNKIEYKDSEWSPSLLREFLNSLSLLETSARSYQKRKRSPNSPILPYKKMRKLGM